METATPSTVRINGREQELAGAKTVADLVAALDLDPRTVAVERNGEIAPRRAWSETPVAPGDRFEIVRFVQGG
jgi:thiamine biosynthesis protein ThiS